MQAITPQVERPFRPAEAFEVLNNDTRRRMLDLLRRAGSSEVLALADQLGLSNLKLYNHLALLEQAGLVRVREAGGVRTAKFRAVGWARLKKRWEESMSGVPGRALAVVR